MPGVVTSKTFEQLEDRIRDLMNDTDRGNPIVGSLLLIQQYELCLQQMAEDKVLGTNDTGFITYADGVWQMSPDQVLNVTDPLAFPAGSQVLSVIRTRDNFPMVPMPRDWIDDFYSSSPARPLGTPLYYTVRVDATGLTWIDVAPASAGDTEVNIRYRYLPAEVSFPSAEVLGVKDTGLLRVVQLKVAERCLRSLPDDQLAKLRLSPAYIDMLAADARRLEQAATVRILLARKNDRMTEASA